jgi:hypothetical protein
MAPREEMIQRGLLFVAGPELENVFWPTVTGDSAGARVMGLMPKKQLKTFRVLRPYFEHRRRKIPQLGESIVSGSKPFS